MEDVGTLEFPIKNSSSLFNFIKKPEQKISIVRKASLISYTIGVENSRRKKVLQTLAASSSFNLLIWPTKRKFNLFLINENSLHKIKLLCWLGYISFVILNETSTKLHAD